MDPRKGPRMMTNALLLAMTWWVWMAGLLWLWTRVMR